MTMERIDRVIFNLRPKGALRNQYGPPQDIAKRMAHEEIPGLSIAVVSDGRIESTRGFGVKEVGRPEPVTPETLFEAASITKTVFTVVVMELVRDKVLDLDEDVNVYLRSWKVPKNGDWQPVVTLRQILSHTSGLNIHGLAGYGRDGKIPTLLQILNGEPPSIQPPITVDGIPGLQNRYSTGGYGVAEQVVADATGRPVSELIHDLVIEPLNMNRSSVAEPLPSHLDKLMAAGHTWSRQTVKGRTQAHASAVSRLRTTPSDLARLGIEIQRAITGAPTKVLSKASAMQMLTPPIGIEWGLGLRVTGEGESSRFWMTGSSFGFVAKWVFYRELGKGAVVMNNFDWGDLFLYEVTRSIAEEYQWPDYSDTLQPEDRVPADLSSETLNPLAGRYFTEDGTAFEVWVKKGNILLKPPLQPPLELIAESATRFFTTVANVEVTFDRAVSGETEGLVIRQSGTQTVAAKE